MFCYTEHENSKQNKEVSSEDILPAQDYCQNKFSFECKQEFLELALIYIKGVKKLSWMSPELSVSDFY